MEVGVIYSSWDWRQAADGVTKLHRHSGVRARSRLHSIPDTAVEVAVARGAVMREAWEGLDGVDVKRTFALRGAVMKTVPSSCLAHSGTFF